MPYDELVSYLASQGDKVAAFTSASGDKLMTQKGRIYHRSLQGHKLNGKTWEKVYTWHRN